MSESGTEGSWQAGRMQICASRPSHVGPADPTLIQQDILFRRASFIMPPGRHIHKMLALISLHHPIEVSWSASKSEVAHFGRWVQH